MTSYYPKSKEPMTIFRSLDMTLSLSFNISVICICKGPPTHTSHCFYSYPVCQSKSRTPSLKEYPLCIYGYLSCHSPSYYEPPCRGRIAGRAQGNKQGMCWLFLMDLVWSFRSRQEPSGKRNQPYGPSVTIRNNYEVPVAQSII